MTGSMKTTRRNGGGRNCWTRRMTLPFGREMDNPRHKSHHSESHISKHGLAVTCWTQNGSGGEDRTPDLGIMRPSLYH